MYVIESWTVETFIKFYIEASENEAGDICIWRLMNLFGASWLEAVLGPARGM